MVHPIDRALYVACLRADVNEVKRLIEEEGADPHHGDFDDMHVLRTPLSATATKTKEKDGFTERRLEIARYLVDTWKPSPFHMANAYIVSAITGNARVQALLMARGATFLEGPVFPPTDDDYANRAALAHPLLRALSMTNTNVLAGLLADGYVAPDHPIWYAGAVPPSTVFCQAVVLRKWKHAEMLLDAGADPARLAWTHPETHRTKGEAVPGGLKKYNIEHLRKWAAGERRMPYRTAMELAMAHPLCPATLRRKLGRMRLDAERALALEMGLRARRRFDALAETVARRVAEGRNLRSRRACVVTAVARAEAIPESVKAALLRVTTTPAVGMEMHEEMQRLAQVPAEIGGCVVSFLAPPWQASYVANVDSVAKRAWGV